MLQLPRLRTRRANASSTALAIVLLAAVLLPALLFAQSPSPQPQPAPAAPPPAAAPPATAQEPAVAQDKTSYTPTAEVVTRDSATTFHVRVNLVLVRVVVRDSHGNVIDNLKKEDFQLFDNRKLQTISTFGLDTPASHILSTATASDRPESGGGQPVQPIANVPQRFVSLLFDDLNLEMSDAMNVRLAAGKILDGMAPADRLSLSTTSGQVHQDFTADRELLKNALSQITPRPTFPASVQDCPSVSYYQADLMVNKNDDQAVTAATEDALQCAFGGDRKQLAAARTLALSAANRMVSTGDASSDFAYRHMEDALRRLAGMPGQRKMVFVSPGFIISTLFSSRSDVVDRANRAGVVIDTIDARGLYTPDVLGDIANPPQHSATTSGITAGYRIAAQSAQTEILEDLAYGTGGSYFHNRNDLDVAFHQAVSAPAASYLLGFSPQNLKLNGSFHTLKVALVGKRPYSIQARRGFYAPRTRKDPEETAKEEIQEAVFSQEEIRDLPVDLQTQFFRTDPTKVRLSVLAHVDLKAVKFRRVDDRNRDDLTLATVVFDENGNFVSGSEKILEMKLLDATLARLDRSGITVKSSFDVKPGAYLVRLVVRDKEGELMAARNGAVVIPY